MQLLLISHLTVSSMSKCYSIRHFQPGECTSRGILRDCEIFANLRFQLYNIHIKMVKYELVDNKIPHCVWTQLIQVLIPGPRAVLHYINTALTPPHGITISRYHIHEMMLPKVRIWFLLSTLSTLLQLKLDNSWPYDSYSNYVNMKYFNHFT